MIGALVVDGAELKASRRKGAGRGHEQYLTETETRCFHLAEAGLGPRVVHGHEKDDVVRYAEGVNKKGSDLAPRGIGEDPADRFAPREEVTIAFDFAPSRAGRKIFQDMAIASTRLEDATGRREMSHELLGKRWRRLDVVVGDIIAVGLVAHPKLQTQRGNPVQQKRGPVLLSKNRAINLATTYSRGT